MGSCPDTGIDLTNLCWPSILSWRTRVTTSIWRRWWDWHTLDEEDQINTILDEMYIKNYDDEEKQQNRSEMTDTNAK